MAFHKLCNRAELPPGEIMRFDRGPVAIALYNVEGEFFATQDLCTHGEWSLSDGYLEGHVVECSLHWAKFCIRTGKVKALPASVPLRTFEVKLDGENVLVDLDRDDPMP